MIKGHPLQQRFTLTLALAAGLALSGCHSGLLKGKKHGTPTIGERIPVLNFETKVEAEPELRDVAVVLPAPESNADWPQPGGSPSKSNGQLELPATLGHAWTVSIGKGSTKTRRLNAAPIVDAGKVFTMDTDGDVRAFDVRTGSTVWNTHIPAPAATITDKKGRKKVKKGREDAGFGGGVSAGSGRVYATTGYGIVAAFDAATGGKIWQISLGTPLRNAPSVSGNRIYAVTADNQLFALSADKGETLWNVTGTTEVAGTLGSAAPAIDRDTVVVGFSSGELNALREENGRTVWADALARTGRTTALAALTDIDASPVIDKGRVFAIGHGGRMAAIELATGQRVWERNFAGVQIPWVAGDYIFTVTLDGEVVCVQRNDGKIRWVLKLDRYGKPKKKEDPIIWSGPVLASDRLLIAGSNRQLMTVSPYTGKLISAVKLAAPAFLPPIVAGKTVYLLTDDGKLNAYR